VFGVAAELVERLRIKIAKNRMLAQDRQLAARRSPSFTRLVLRHAGHDHLIILIICPSSAGRAECKRLDVSYNPPHLRLIRPHSAHGKKGLDYLQAFQLVAREKIARRLTLG
jgi:hypothetical protein